MEEYDRLELIHLYLNDFWKVLRNINTLSFLTISEGNFNKLIQSLNKEAATPKLNEVIPELNVDAPAM